MAKDDYDVLTFKVLTYLYACMKHKIIFEQTTFQYAVLDGGNVNADYFSNVLFMMQEEGLIKGLTFAGAWGGDHILACDVSSASITADGFHYLKDNSAMQKIKNAMVEGAELIGSLAVLVGLP